MATAARHRPVPDLDAILNRLYGSLAEDLSFLHCLDVVGAALRSHVSAVQHEDYEEHQSWLELIGEVSKEQHETLTAEYASRWHGQNLWLNRGLPALLHRGYGEGDEVVLEKELFATPYYQHFLRQIDIRYGLGICVWHNGPGKLAVATFNRTRSEGPFERDAMAFVAALRPHLVNAYTIYMHATHLADTNRSLRATMNRAPIGMMILDINGRILETNEESERLLAAKCGLSRGAGGCLVADRWQEQQKLTAMLTELSACTLGTVTRSLTCTHRAGGAHEGVVLHLCVVPASPQLRSTTRLVAFLKPLSAAHADSLDLGILQSALSLTPTESRVLLELRRCHDLQEVAVALGISSTTARTHLQHAFAKTDTRKQSELLGVIDRVVTTAPRLI